ncbi:MAG: FkbM family methyltransferase [bacterium]|nr:FkbM family methyltransferase [bacterium]
MKITKQIRWKFLLAVFKLKRFVHRWLGLRRLDYDEKDIFILTDTLREYETRARSVIKEPKTVSWIKKHGGHKAVLYDIGANIGAYSLIAASEGARVVAFEPAHQNIYKLHENILLNKLNDKITVVPLMLAEKNGIAKSFVADRSFGTTHSFSFNEKSSDALAGQDFLAMGLDSCIKTFLFPEPTMIKIDVDGAEMEVLIGARELLNSPILKHILIEVDNNNNEIKKYIMNMRFRLVDEERSGTYTTNYIFERL